LPLDETLTLEEFLIGSAKLISISKNQYFEALKIAKENRSKCFLDIYGYAKNNVYEIFHSRKILINLKE